MVVPRRHALARRKAVAFAESLDYDHVGLHATSSIYLAMRAAAASVDRAIRLRIHVTGLDAMCRMIHNGLGVGVMLLTSGILMMPNGFITIVHPDGVETTHLHYEIHIVWFAILVFLLGCAMGFGKAAVFKHIPEYFPDNVGSVGGLVGMFGGLGGFFLPPLFAYSKQWSGFPTSTFFVLFLLTAACAIWMHWTVVHMLHKESPDLSRHLESPSGAATAS